MKEKFKKLVHTMRFHLSFILALGFILGLITTLGMTHYRLNKSMLNNYTRMADGATNMVIAAIDTEKIDAYIDENFSSEEYLDVLRVLHSIKDNYPDIYYLYVYDLDIEQDHAARVIFDLDEEFSETPEQESIDWIGDVYELDEPFYSEWEELSKSREPIYHTVTTEDGEHLFSYIKPVFDKDGNYCCSACVDFSMTALKRKNQGFILRLALTLIGLDVFLWFLFMHFINSKICKPINLIEDTIESFKYDSISDRFNNVSEMEALQLHTGNEVESLYNSFMATIKENVFYIDNFKKAENTISEIQVTAYKDQLTKVGNSNKYKVDMDLLDKRIGNGTARFAVVLADINNLKYINDTYGHDIGDRYIIGCCKVLCDVFKHSAVYRIGGDEFVCISENEDYDSISLLVEQCTAIFESYDESRATAPYERYSMALGFAVFNDHFINVESVVKVADEQMYKNKAEHKKKYGSYR